MNQKVTNRDFAKILATWLPKRNKNVIKTSKSINTKYGILMWVRAVLS